MPNCTDQTNIDNQKKALAENKGKADADKTHYHYDVVVKIKESDKIKKEIAFTAPGPDDTKLHRARWKKGTDKQSRDVWGACPSLLASNATADDYGDPPAVDAEGILYLSARYLKDEAKAGREIWAERAKWPEELAASDVSVRDLPVQLTSVVVAGVELVTGEQFPWRFDLMNPEYGGPEQSIVYTATSKAVTLSLTSKAFGHFHVSTKPFEELVEAEKVINSKTVDPRRKAWAWRIVATCESTAATELQFGRIKPDDLARLSRLLGRTPPLPPSPGSPSPKSKKHG